MKAYSLDLRERVMKAYDEGHWTVRELSERFQVGEWWIYKLKRQRSHGGSLEPQKGPVGQPRKLREADLDRLQQYINKHPGATLEEIREQLGIACTVVTLHHTLRRLGYRYKRNAAGQRTRSR